MLFKNRRFSFGPHWPHRAGHVLGIGLLCVGSPVEIPLGCGKCAWDEAIFAKRENVRNGPILESGVSGESEIKPPGSKKAKPRGKPRDHTRRQRDLVFCDFGTSFAKPDGFSEGDRKQISSNFFIYSA